MLCGPWGCPAPQGAMRRAKNQGNVFDRPETLQSEYGDDGAWPLLEPNRRHTGIPHLTLSCGGRRAEPSFTFDHHSRWIYNVYIGGDRC